VSIRRATVADGGAIGEIFLAARAEMTYLPHVHSGEETRAFFMRAASEHELWVAEQSEIVGFAAIDGAVLEHLYVHPGWQGRGFGSLLLAEAKRARPRGLRLWLFQQNAAARRFYERHGFRLVAETDGASNEERVADALYEWLPDTPARD
jgi:ribosomal protein S18 acetylase RimI-like enzyme